MTLRGNIFSIFFKNSANTYIMTFVVGSIHFLIENHDISFMQIYRKLIVCVAKRQFDVFVDNKMVNY